MTPFLIESADIPPIWSQVGYMLEAGLKTACGEMDIGQLRMLLMQGKAKLVVGYDEKEKIRGALAYQFKEYPNYRVCYVLSVGGKGVIESKAGYEQFKDHMRSMGCKEIEGWCTPETARLWQRIGFKQVYSVMRTPL